MMRIGQGFDVHALEDGTGDLILGGVTIPFHKTLKAHSDGDVLVHALCDALLGASGLGDIGRHFPDKDPQYQNISSLKLLGAVMTMLRADGWALGNADITVIAQAPKIAPYAQKMIDKLAEAMGCKAQQFNIKATTSEQLGFTGRGEGIACQAITLIEYGENST